MKIFHGHDKEKSTCNRLATDLLMRSRRLARAYLECGSSSGEPIAIGPGVDGMLEDEADAAASGCKKFRL